MRELNRGYYQLIGILVCGLTVCLVLTALLVRKSETLQMRQLQRRAISQSPPAATIKIKNALPQHIPSGSRVKIVDQNGRSAVFEIMVAE